MRDDLRLDQLTREMGWIRGLARALVSRDADDLAHDAWLVAAEQAPADRPLRPWLVRVTTNLARMRGRSAARRERRELATEIEATPTPAELVERVELGRVVAAEVIALDEPYRSTILLHFFEGLTSVEIARRLGVPDGTVRRRLKVGLDRLRERLRDRSDPPEGGWLAALAPLVGPIPSAKPAVATATTGAAMIVLATLVIAAGVIWQVASTTSSGDAAAIAVAPPITHVYPAVTRRDPSAAPPRLEPAKLAQTDAPPRRIAGTVTASGSPVAGAIVRLGLGFRAGQQRAHLGLALFAQPIATVTTDDHGSFDFGELPAARFVVAASAGGQAPAAKTLALADPGAGADRLELALGDCTTRLSGRVRDAAGTAIQGAHVVALDLASVESAADGTYAMCVAEHAIVRVSADGFAAMEATAAGTGDVHRDLVLAPEAVAIGRVVDERGRAVDGARVIAFASRFPGQPIGDFATESWGVTDADGRFQIDGLAAGAYTLVADAPGHVEAESMPVVAAPGRPVETRLVMGAGARIRGRVRRDGQPVGGVAVNAAFFPSAANIAVSQPDGTFVLDGVSFGYTSLFGTPIAVVAKEVLVDRREIAVDLEARPSLELHGRVTRAGGAPVMGATVTCDSLAPVAPVTTDEQGAYTCRDVQAYQLGVAVTAPCDHAPPSTKFETRALNTNNAVDVLLPDCASAASIHVRGIVVDRAGVPLAQVEVLLGVKLGSRRTTTNAAGGFEADAEVGARLSVSTRRRFDQYPLVGSMTRHQAALADGSAPLRLVVDDEAAPVVGRVVDIAGAPVGDARVHVDCGWDVHDPLHSDLSRGDGTFSIPGVLAIDNCTVLAMVGEQRASARWSGSPVELGVGARVSIRRELAGWDHEPTVRARSVATGVEVAGEIHDDEVELGVQPGLYTIVATDGVHKLVDTQYLGGGDHESELRPFGVGPRSARYHVVDADTGASLPDVACEPQPEGSGPVAVTDRLGALDVPMGWYQCWSVRGPANPVTIVEQTGHDTIVANLDRPGTANAGFVIGPVSSRLVVAVVEVGGSAAAADLRAGDAIVELDGAGVTRLSPQDLMYLVWTHPRGTLRLVVDRDGSRRAIAIPIRD